MGKHPDSSAPTNGAPRSTALAILARGESDADAGVDRRESAGSRGPRPGEADSAGYAIDYPRPRALGSPDAFDWYVETPLVENIAALGALLAKAGDLYRTTAYGGGLMLASSAPHIPLIRIDEPRALAAILVDRVRVRVLKNAKIQGSGIPSAQLATMLRTEAFLQAFAPVDSVDRQSRYLPDFTLTRPGYNDGGYGQRILHVGDVPRIEPQAVAIPRFLDVMAFASDADRTHAVAAALTLLLRNHWPGGKPCLAITSTKSHGGKETIVHFAAGTTRHASISYESADWALQKALVAALKSEPDLGLIDVENARVGRGRREIRSSFLERFLTDADPLLHSPGTGGPVRRRNDVIVAITTNDGTVSEDLLNRALPIRLDPVGDVAARRTPIGNPKLEFLPAHRDRIEAELRGFIERWKREGCPLDATAHHPFSPWARTLGGILRVNGFCEFLGNYARRKTADDPVRRGLGLLGARRKGEWLPSRDWAALVRSLGLVKAVIPEADRDTDLGHERGIGVVLSAHRDETFAVETEDERSVLRLEKARKRFEPGGGPSTRYRFEVVSGEEIPLDPGGDGPE